MSTRWAPLLILAIGCGVRTKRIEPLACAGADGQVLEGPVEIALVGHLADASDALVEVLSRESPALVVLTGDVVERSTVAAWGALRTRLGALPVSPLAGEGEKRADRNRRGFVAAFSDLGAQGMRGDVTWRAFDVVEGGLRWRFVVLDADRQGVGDRWTDQLFWLPKVTGDEGYDHLVLITNRPGSEVSVRELWELAQEHAGSSRTVLLVAGGADVVSARLPGGRWGVAHVDTGRPVPPVAMVDPSGLAPGLQDALAAELERRDDGADLALAGWWQLHLYAGALELTLRLADGSDWPAVYTLGWSPAEGWQPR